MDNLWHALLCMRLKIQSVVFALKYKGKERCLTLKVLVATIDAQWEGM